MDFFARQDHARKLTARLAWLFAVAVLATVAAVNLLTYAGVEWYLRETGGRGDRPLNIEAEDGQRSAAWMTDLHLKAQVLTTLVTLAVIGLGSLFKTAQLRGGGPTVAVSLGGRPAQPERYPREQQLVNVVEEMAIASGVPMPQVYVLDREEGINAFAAGLGQHDAVVAVTSGALQRFTRDELQAVIGHEFSHILNGDMRINLRLMGLIHGILVIALTGRLVLRLAANSGRSRSSDGKGNGALPLMLAGLGLLVVGSIGYFFGQLIKAAISRQREFLADAAAVQFTRNPGAMANALKRLGAGSARAIVGHPRTSEASHLFFGSAVAAPFMGLLATHPPLAERIRAIEPHWDGSFPAAATVDLPAPGTARRTRQPASAFAGPGPALAADTVVARIGTVSPQQVDFGAVLVDTLPLALRNAAHDPFSARAVVIALLLGGDRAKAVPQMDLLERSGDHALVREVRRLHPLTATLDARARLPLLEISCPALANLSASQRTPFLTLLDHLARADGVVSPLEYCLTRLVTTHLAPPAVRSDGIHAMAPLLAPAAVLLSALARFGHQDPAAQRQALAAGAARLVERGATMSLLPVDQCGPAQLDTALARLAQASPGLKRRLMDACAWAVAADGTVQPGEAELLRVVGMMLGCPVPPFADRP
jgi:Zn-dependent protease with chaperone function